MFQGATPGLAVIQVSTIGKVMDLVLEKRITLVVVLSLALAHQLTMGLELLTASGEVIAVAMLVSMPVVVMTIVAIAVRQGKHGRLAIHHC